MPDIVTRHTLIAVDSQLNITNYACSAGELFFFVFAVWFLPAGAVPFYNRLHRSGYGNYYLFDRYPELKQALQASCESWCLLMQGPENYRSK